jgi:hypothetical protein
MRDLMRVKLKLTLTDLRAIAETAMYRAKQLFGGSINPACAQGQPEYAFMTSTVVMARSE